MLVFCTCTWVDSYLCLRSVSYHKNIPQRSIFESRSVHILPHRLIRSLCNKRLETITPLIGSAGREELE